MLRSGQLPSHQIGGDLHRGLVIIGIVRIWDPVTGQSVFTQVLSRGILIRSPGLLGHHMEVYLHQRLLI